MIRKATGTIAARLIITMMGLGVTMLAGHRLGARGLGDISLIVLGITAVMLLANLIGGGALVYLAPRVERSKLLIPAYLWVLCTTVISYAALQVIPIVPQIYVIPVVILAAIQGFYTIHLNLLLGQQRIKTYNWIGIAQAVVLFTTFLLLTGPTSIERRGGALMAYVDASVAAFVCTLLLSTWALFARRPKAPIAEPGLRVIPEMLRLGGLMSLTNGLQLMNYRLAYWLIDRFRGTSPLGVYSVGTQLAEGAWIAPRSLGMVLYSRMSNTHELATQRERTIVIMKAAMACALGVLLLIGLLPDAVFRTLFGEEITGLAPIVWLLAPGILAMSASQAFSHFFSGTGRNKQNLISSAIGLLVTIAGGFLLIPRFGLHGAAITASLTHLGSVIYQIVVFQRITGATAGELLPHSGDAERIRRIVASAMNSLKGE